MLLPSSYVHIFIVMLLHLFLIYAQNVGSKEPRFQPHICMMYIYYFLIFHFEYIFIIVFMNVTAISLDLCVTFETKPGGEKLINWDPLLSFVVLDRLGYFSFRATWNPRIICFLSFPLQMVA